ncbi:MAG: hypothetical protein H7A46_19545 [Verrucomicrobiales bacterium]|nr:hypothetical protein [Verrucomicrobiales bacterium]
MKHHRHDLLLVGLLISLPATGLCGDSTPLTWDPYFQSSVTKFTRTNQWRIENLTNVSRVDASRLRGLEIHDRPLAEWSHPDATLSRNIVYLYIRTHSANLDETFFDAILHYRALEHLSVSCSSATNISASIGRLAQLGKLRSLALYASKAGEIPREIYDVKGLEELTLSVGNANLPAGISKLRQLSRFTLRANSGEGGVRTPSDLQNSSVEYLHLMRVGSLDRRLPELPSKTRLLKAWRCGLEGIPNGWCKQRTVEALDLSDNSLNSFPLCLLENPALKILSLDWNKITEVPPLPVPASRRVSISIVGNPLKEIAPENEELIKKGILNK